MPEVAPEHRPRREPAAVRVELVAARPAALEPRHEQVDQPLGLAQLGRRHPVELAVAQDLALRVRVGRDDDALDRRLVVAVVVRPRRERRCRARPGRISPRSAPGSGGASPGASSLGPSRRPASAAVDGSELVRGARAAPPPAAVEHRVVDRPGRRGGGRRRPRRPPGPARGRRCRRGSAPARSRSPRRGRSSSRAARSARPKPTASRSRRRPSTSAPNGRADDGGVGHGVSLAGQPPRRGLGEVARAVPSPRTWRMSSSYLRTTPRVSSTSSGASSRAPSDRSAAAQSSVSAMPGHLGQVGLAQAVDEADDLAGQALRRLGHPGEHDLELLLRPSGSRSSGTGSAA